MRAVWKFAFDYLDSEPVVDMPEYATILHFDMDPASKSFAVWAEVDTEANIEQRKFIIRGTGHGIGVPDDKTQFIGSVITNGFVFHCWEYDEEGFTQPWETMTSP